MSNIDHKTVASFGDEWSRFDQTGMTDAEASKAFDEYFAVFPWMALHADAEGFDMGCGSGRWAKFVAPRVGKLHCIDPSAALDVARSVLVAHKNVVIHQGSVDSPGLQSESQDFGYSLGVLHHIPDTAAAIRSCVALLKPGAPLLLYLYYAFENRPAWFRAFWQVSDFVRRFIYRMPPMLKHMITDIIAVIVYWPLARLSAILEHFSVPVNIVVNMPLYYYRHRTFYTMRTDARDRFGTPLEKRFTRSQIVRMMEDAGLVDITFSEDAPYWCVVGIKGQS